MNDGSALVIGAISAVVMVLSVRAWRSPVEVEDDDWGDEAWWAELIRGHAAVAAMLGALGLALAIAVVVAG
ncbi:hypothetical protein [Rubrivirga sp. IMCC43871]|uniref:hypothetical protein n=1 Tax=Rubrivirga sp. IMCC43871 TaxID=3391575 RepID=UPI003990071C